MDWAYFTLLAVAVQCLGLWMAIDVVMKGRTAQGAIAWALGLLLLPLVAVPLYLVFGERKFAGYIRSHRRGKSEIDQVAAQLAAQLRPFVAVPIDSLGTTAALTKLVRLPFTNRNHVELLVDGKDTFDAIIEAIERARHYVLVQFYIIRDDGAGRRVQAALLAARARGVRVYFIYDELGSYDLPRQYLDALRAAQCECSGFRTKPRKQRPFRINFRNHRKIVVVDGRIAFVGGHNIGDEYLGLHDTLRPWRDTHVAIRGPAVQCVQLAFLEDWFWAQQAIPDLEWTPEPAEGAGVTVLVAPSGPADELDTCSLLFTQLVQSARTRLWLTSPYFVPDEQLIGAIQLASLRGVDMRLLISELSDSLLPHLSAFSYYNDIMPSGGKIHRYQSGFLHQKVLLADTIACVGTANLDNRSFRINFEITIVVADADFSAQVAAMLEKDLAASRQVAKDEFDRRPFLFRLACRVARLLSPIQ